MSRCYVDRFGYHGSKMQITCSHAILSLKHTETVIYVLKKKHNLFWNYNLDNFFICMSFRIKRQHFRLISIYRSLLGQENHALLFELGSVTLFHGRQQKCGNQSCISFGEECTCPPWHIPESIKTFLYHRGIFQLFTDPLIMVIQYQSLNYFGTLYITLGND